MPLYLSDQERRVQAYINMLWNRLCAAHVA
jgi:hypothetical protein